MLSTGQESSLEAAFERGRILKAALEEIRREQGKVCQCFELCHHESCGSSYASWAIADIALTRIKNLKRSLDI